MHTISSLFEKGTIGFSFYRNEKCIGHHWIRRINSNYSTIQKIQARVDIDLSSYDDSSLGFSHMVRQAEILFEETEKMFYYRSIGTEDKMLIAEGKMMRSQILL